MRVLLYIEKRLKDKCLLEIINAFFRKNVCFIIDF